MATASARNFSNQPPAASNDEQSNEDWAKAPIMPQQPSRFDQMQQQPSRYDQMQQGPSQQEQLQRGAFGAGALSNAAVPTVPTVPRPPQQPDRTMYMGQPQPPMGGGNGDGKMDPTMRGGMMRTANGSEIGQSPMNPSAGYVSDPRHTYNYAEKPGFGNADFHAVNNPDPKTFGENGLANRAARPVGRSMRDHPERRMEMAERSAMANGDYEGAARMAGSRMYIKQQAQNLEQDGVRDSQSMYVNQMQEQGREARHQQTRQDRFDMYNATQAQTQKRQDESWQHNRQAFYEKQGYDAMKYNRDQTAQQQQEQQDREYGLQPTKVDGTSTPYFHNRKGSIFAGSAPEPSGPLPDGMVPQHAQRGGVQYGMPQQGKPEKPQISWQTQPDGSKVPYQTKIDPVTGEVTMHRVKVHDANGDGIPDRKQGGGGGAAKPSGFLNF